MRITAGRSRCCCSTIRMRTLRVSRSGGAVVLRDRESESAALISVNKGDRVAQLILERIAMAPLLEVDVSFLAFLGDVS